MLLLMEAFDKVPLNRLTVKLKSYGIGGVVLDCWKAFLTDTEQRSVVKDDYPEWNEVPSGFPQSSVLRPILFVSYINDLPDRVAGDPMLYMVAGDTKLSRTLFDVSDTDILQWDMDDIEGWSYEWPMDWRFICHMLKIWSCTIRTAYASIRREKFSKKTFWWCHITFQVKISSTGVRSPEHMVHVVVPCFNKVTISMHGYLGASRSPPMPQSRCFNVPL